MRRVGKVSSRTFCSLSEFHTRKSYLPLPSSPTGSTNPIISVHLHHFSSLPGIPPSKKPLIFSRNNLCRWSAAVSRGRAGGKEDSVGGSGERGRRHVSSHLKRNIKKPIDFEPRPRLRLLFLLLSPAATVLVSGDECHLTPVIHVLQYPGCTPKPIPSYACTGRCTSYVQVYR